MHHPERRPTAVLFVDMVDSTPLALSLGDGAWAELLERYHALVRGALARHRGRLMDTAGDGFYAVFDDTVDTIRCALEIREAVKELGVELRCGIHLGHCWTADGKCAGADVHVGARLARAAEPGEIILSEEAGARARRAGLEVADRGARSLKGLDGSRRVYAVGAPISSGARTTAPARRCAIVLRCSSGSGMSTLSAPALASVQRDVRRDLLSDPVGFRICGCVGTRRTGAKWGAARRRRRGGTCGTSRPRAASAIRRRPRRDGASG